MGASLHLAWLASRIRRTVYGMREKSRLVVIVGSVAAPVLGVTAPRHRDDAAAALDITLSDREHVMLTAPYTPRQPTGY